MKKPQVAKWNIGIVPIGSKTATFKEVFTSLDTKNTSLFSNEYPIRQWFRVKDKQENFDIRF